MQYIKHNISLILVSLVVLLPFLPLAFGYFPAVGDMRDVFIPIETFFRTEQLHGNIPAWNPAVSFGFPVIGAAQIGFFYPALYLLRFLPIWLELPIALISHVALCAVGLFLFSRRLGLSKEASVFTALSFALSQFVWQHLTHLNIFLAVAWFPWQMLSVDILFRKEKLEAKGIAALIGLFGIPFLIGQIQIPFLMMAVAMVYGLYVRTTVSPPRMRGSWRGSIVAICIISLGTFLFASVQLLPTLELAALSSRGNPDGFDIVRANQHSFPLYHVPTFVFPRFYGNDDSYWGKRLEIEYGVYIGVIPLIVALWYLWRGRFLPSYGREKSATTFFLFLLSISFLLALGSLSPFRLLSIEPSFWIFSAPARWLLFTTFSLSIFAGFGFDAMWKQAQQAKKWFQSIAVALIGLIVFGNLLLSIPALTLALSPIGERESLKIASMIASARTSSVSLQSPYTYLPIVLLLFLPYALSHKHGKQLVIALTILDLVLIAGTTTPLLPWNSILEAPPTINHLSENILQHEARIYSLRDGGDTGAYFTNPESRANTEKRELQKNLLLPMLSSQFGVYGIEWPASLDIAEQGAALELLHPTEPYAIENEELAQELTIGTVLSPREDGGINITQLQSKSRFELLCNDSPTPSNSSPFQGEAGWGESEDCKENLMLVSEKPSELIFKTNAKEDTTLIVRDTFYPGWHAYVDGIEVPIEKSPLFFRSVAVPQGDHVIEMKYEPNLLYAGGAVTLIILLICAIVLNMRTTLRTR